MTAPLIGTPVDRVDGRLKVTGAAKYSAEWPMRGTLYAVMVMSTVAKGRVVSIDTAAAERLPGVVRIFTHRNAPKLSAGKQNPNDRILPALQDDFVRYDRQPIALVVADTIERATGAAQRVSARYENSADVRLFDHYTPQQQQAPEINQAPADFRKGDAQAALAAAAVHVDNTYRTPTEHHNPMEPHATTATWDGDHLTLYDATQGVFSTRNRVAYVLGVPVGNVHVITKYVGGGFGGKGSAWTHVVLAAMASRELGHPVKLVLTRPQMFSSVGNRPPTSQRVAIGASSDGKIGALIHESTSATSTFDTFVEPAAMISRVLYDAPNITSTHHLVRVDVPTPTYMRAPGESSGSFALESAMDELAYVLHMDPIELRLRNYAEVDPEKGIPFSSKSLRECYRQGAERFGWANRKPAPRSMRDGRLLVGMGMASATYPTHRSRASANARIMSDGSALVTAGSQDIGTGAYTVFTQLSAHVLGLPIERVRFDLGDTTMPMTPTSGGSQTTASVGSAVKMAGDAAIAKLIDLAVADASSPLHGVQTQAIVHGDGRIFVASQPSRGESYAAVLSRSGLTQIDASADAMPGAEQKEYAMHAFGAQFAEVRIDPDLGEIRIARMVGAFASGRILNEKTGRSQYLGGMVYGVGMGLLEETLHDVRLGRVMTANLADYLVPVHADIPTFDAILVPEEDAHVNPIGVKGIGEIGIVGVAAAIANAVYHATGKRIRDLPVTAAKIFA